MWSSSLMLTDGCGPAREKCAISSPLLELHELVQWPAVPFELQKYYMYTNQVVFFEKNFCCSITKYISTATHWIENVTHLVPFLTIFVRQIRNVVLLNGVGPQYVTQGSLLRNFTKTIHFFNVRYLLGRGYSNDMKDELVSKAERRRTIKAQLPWVS